MTAVAVPGLPPCTVVVPFRGEASGTRRRNLAVVLDWLARLRVEIVLVEQASTWSSPFVDGPQARHILFDADEEFCKAKACNLGAVASRADVLGFVDADVVLQADALQSSIYRCTVDMDVIRPFGWLVDLDQDASERVLSTLDVPHIEPREPSDDRAGNTIPLCGGAFVIRRTAFESVGGMDEAFVGWGAEDDALSTALRRSGMRCGVIRTRPAIHLWHARSKVPGARARYESNVRRAQRWADCDDAAFGRLVAAGQERLREHRRAIDA